VPGADEIDSLLAEQLAYYRARAPEYTETAIPEIPSGRLRYVRDAALAALRDFCPTGEVLELACGPGTWTQTLAEHADRVTALDGAPEMLELARAKVSTERVRFVRTDLFSWNPDRLYDAVFFGFWLSHVPLERFDSFWELVGRCLAPGGRVAFVDDAYRTDDELIHGPDSAVVRRHLNNGTPYHAVKVPHTPASLQARLERLGWAIDVRYLAEPFFWGAGGRADRG
jgi:SAM-dependent methyltransferase